VNDAALASSPDYVRLQVIDDIEYLLYRSIPIDVAIIRATEVDADGNASQDEEAVWLDTLAIAQAARASGGIVICQAKRIVAAGTIAPRRVTVPGCVIDFVAHTDDPASQHRQTAAAEFDSAYISARPPTVPDSADQASPSAGRPVRSAAAIPLSPRLSIARRAVRFLHTGDVVNLGTGIPGDAVGPALDEIGQASAVLLTLESGVYGGIPEGGVDFGISRYPSAIVPQSSQFDFYNGGGLDVAIMGLGQLDAEGNVNVSSLAGKRIGCGGFIDITQSARTVLFCFVFESKFGKFVTKLDEISFAASQARRLGQQVHYISDKSVFSLAADGGLSLDEIAAGVTVDSVLAAVPFEVAVSDRLTEMDPALFDPEVPAFELAQPRGVVANV
jgi:propionate CoA-transferase